MSGNKKQILIPLIALIALAVFNLIMDSSFFIIKFGPNAQGFNVLSGNLIDVFDKGSELAILALGMTLVTSACGGQDISVGATLAVAGSVMMRFLTGGANSVDKVCVPVFVAFILGCIAAMILGAFNGVLVAKFKIQPMVATLILFTAGRPIAAWINDNRNIKIKDATFSYWGTNLPNCPVPTPVLLTILCILVMFLILKFTNLGLYCQAVGINESSSRLNGIHPNLMKFLSFVILGAFVSVAALIKISRYSTINYSGVAKDIEMDAILAVALGGNPLGGGKFNIWASVIGAYVIQLLTVTLYAFRVSSDALPAYKAVVVILLVVASSPVVQRAFDKLKRKLASKKNKEVA